MKKQLLIALMSLLSLSITPTLAHGGHCGYGGGFHGGSYHGGGFGGGYRGGFSGGYRNFGNFGGYNRGWGYRGGYYGGLGYGLAGAGIGLGLGYMLSNHYNHNYGIGSSYDPAYAAPPPFITTYVTDYDFNGEPYQRQVTANWDNARGGYWYYDSNGRYLRAR